MTRPLESPARQNEDEAHDSEEVSPPTYAGDDQDVPLYVLSPPPMAVRQNDEDTHAIEVVAAPPVLPTRLAGAVQALPL